MREDCCTNPSGYGCYLATVHGNTNTITLTEQCTDSEPQSGTNMSTSNIHDKCMKSKKKAQYLSCPQMPSPSQMSSSAPRNTFLQRQPEHRAMQKIHQTIQKPSKST
eukprot:scaffold124289_cov63-Attheya_sp.AAC.3